MPTLPLDRYLAAEEGFQPVIAKAREIDSLSRLCVALLPPELSRYARVANCKDGTLVMLAANGPVAAKLKMLAEGLAAALSKQGAKVNSVSVRVQPSAGMAFAAPQHRAPTLSEGGLRELQALHERLDDSPLRRSLRKLLDHHEARRAPPPARKTSGPG